MDTTLPSQHADKSASGTLLGSIDIDQLPIRIFEEIQQLYLDQSVIEVLKNPYTGVVVFSSDQRYFLDDAHNGAAINPFQDVAVGGSNIVDSANNVMMSIKDYHRFYSSLDYGTDVTAGRKRTLARAIEQHLNGIQEYSENIDVDYLIEDADDYAVAVLNGTSQAFIDAMNSSGHDVQIEGGNRWGSSSLNGLQGYGFDSNMSMFSNSPNLSVGMSSERLVNAIKAAKQRKGIIDEAVYSNPMQAAADIANGLVPKSNYADRKSAIEELKSEKPVFEITDLRYDPRKSVLEEYVPPVIDSIDDVDVSDLPGVVVPLNAREQYHHHVSDYQKCKLEIMRDYACGSEAKHRFEEIHSSFTRAIARTCSMFKMLIERTNHPQYGWDVYKVEFDANKNQINIYYVHDLRIHEWTQSMSHKYTGNK